MYKILIVEDDKIMGKVMQRIFVSEHYNVTLTATLASGTEACERELPDLVLLDMNLPDGRGLDLCKKIKETPRLRHIPVVILTGDATSVDNKVDGIEAGAEDYITKPFIAEELIVRVAGIIKHNFKTGN